MKRNRAKVISVKVEIEYTNGERKLIDINPEEDEAIFWSDRAVEDIFAPYYDTYKSKLERDDAEALSNDLGREVMEISSEVVKELWNSPLEVKDESSDLPAIIKKRRKCIPHRPCKLCHI